jgi:hypothetical protein
MTEVQMRFRGFWEPVSHPVVGEHRYPGWSMLLSGGPERWYRTPAPLLGLYNGAVLGGLLELTADEMARSGRGERDWQSSARAVTNHRRNSDPPRVPDSLEIDLHHLVPLLVVRRVFEP